MTSSTTTTTPRYGNTGNTTTSSFQSQSSPSNAPPMKKQRATASPYVRNGNSSSSNFGTEKDGDTTNGCYGSTTTTTASSIRPPTSHSIMVSQQVREAVKSRREELRKLQEQNKYTKSVVFPPANRKQQILSLAKAQLAAATTTTGASSLLNIRKDHIPSIVTHHNKDTIRNKENTSSSTATQTSFTEVNRQNDIGIETPARPRRLDLLLNTNNTAASETSGAIEIEPITKTNSDNNNSRAHVFQTMMKNATVDDEDIDQRYTTYSETTTTTLRLLTELKKSKLQTEEELQDLKNSIQQNSASEPEQEQQPSVLLFDDDITVASVQTTKNNYRSNLGSLMSPIKPSMRLSHKQHGNETSAAAAIVGPSWAESGKQHCNREDSMDQSDTIDNSGLLLQQNVEQAFRVAVQKFTSVSGSEYVIAFVSASAEKNTDSLDYYYEQVVGKEAPLLSKLTKEDHDIVVSSLVSLFQNNNDDDALAKIARYIRVYATILVDQSVLMVHHITDNENKVQQQMIHWDVRTKHMLRQYNLNDNAQSNPKSLQNLLGNIPYIDAQGREREYKLADVYREALVVQHDFLTSIISTTWAFQQTSSSKDATVQTSAETAQHAATTMTKRTAEEDSVMLFDESNTNNSTSSIMAATFGSLVSPIKPVSHHPCMYTANANSTNKTEPSAPISAAFQSNTNQNISTNNTFAVVASSNTGANDATSTSNLLEKLPRYVEQAFCVAVQKFTSSQGNEYQICFASPAQDSAVADEDSQPLSKLSDAEKEEVIFSLVQNMTYHVDVAESTKLARYIRVYANIKADQSRLLVKHEPHPISNDTITGTMQVHILHSKDSTDDNFYRLEPQELLSDHSISEKLGRIIYIDAFGIEQEYNLADVYREAILVQQHFLMGITSSAWAFYRMDILQSHQQKAQNNISRASVSNPEAVDLQHQKNDGLELQLRQQDDTKISAVLVGDATRTSNSTVVQNVDTPQQPLVDHNISVHQEKQDAVAHPIVEDKISAVEVKNENEEPADATVALVMLLGFLFSGIIRFISLIIFRLPLKIFKLVVVASFWSSVMCIVWLYFVDDYGLRLNQLGGAAGRVDASPWPTIPIGQKILNVVFGIGYGGDIDHFHNGVF